MVARVLIIGGYGNFGGYITHRLALEDDLTVIVGGRSEKRARAFLKDLPHGANRPEFHRLDYQDGLACALGEVQPDIVIHTSGPFQGQGYDVAAACIDQGCHYVDLADARDFVSGIEVLDQAAREAGVLVVSGASSVPCLTAAVVDAHMDAFEELTALDYGIATAQQTNRGLATTSAVLSYAGKPFRTLIDGSMSEVYGWQDLHVRALPGVGRRTFSNCDVPDLKLFPQRYPGLRTIRFYAGLEVPVVHAGLWALTWLVRWRLLDSLEPLAPMLLRVSRLFDWLGSDVSAFYTDMTGRDRQGGRKTLTFDLAARSGDGPYIPCAPAIILARMLARGECRQTGAVACTGLIDLETYLGELDELDISWQLTEADAAAA